MIIRLPSGGWKPRPYQIQAWNYWVRDGGRHLELVWHRRSGKDEIVLHGTCIKAHERVANYWHMLPLANQVRKAIWEAVNPKTGMRRIDEAFPKELRESTRDNDMLIKFKCGSTWQALGSDNFQSAIGSNPAGIVYSEWAQANPSARGYLRPILTENNGWQAYITTPRGKNHAYSTFKGAQKDGKSFAQLLTVADTHILTPEQLEEELQEYINTYGDDAGKALYEQEYFCSFDAAILGAYYGAEFARTDKEQRITSVPYDDVVPVHTAWDLGFDDDTAIWFYQVIRGEVHVIDYYYASGKTIEHYAEVLTSKPYKYGNHWLPHDARAKTLASGGKSIIEQLAKLVGLGSMKIAYNLSVEDGIQAARVMFRRTWFDIGNCEDGIEALRQYQREWDDDKKMFKDKPLHNWTSHAADAFRYLAVVWKHEAKESKPEQGKTLQVHGHENMSLNELWDAHDTYIERRDRI